MINKILFSVICFTSLMMSSQTRDIEGTVTDASSETPLLGVNVIVQGTQKGTTTDFDGNFVLESVPEDAVLELSYLGFKTKTIKVSERLEFNIQLVPDTEALDDVVVIGYGTSSKRNITGSVSKVGSETIKQLEPVNAATALQGTTSGVNVTPQSGSPGAESNIRIRGISTNGDNKPLIILDGFQYEGGLNSINPNDIESYTVLKDAQAAIYGSIGSNGVILIETKEGKKNQAAKISYDAYYGMQQTTRKLPLLNATEYGLLLNESYANAGQTSPIQNLSNLGQGTDWQDEVFDIVPVQSHNISVNGGSDKIRYSISGSHLQQEGIVGGPKSEFERSTAKLSLNAELRDNLNITSKVFYNSTTRNLLNDFSLGSVLFNAINIAPTIDPGVDDISNEINLGNEVINPLTQTRNTYNESVVNRLSGTFQVDFNYAENLNLQARIGFNSSNTKNREFLPEFTYGSSKVFNRDSNLVNLGRVNDNDYTFDLFNTYQNTFGEKHDVTFLVGMTVNELFGEALFGSRTGVPSNSFQFADIGTATGAGDNNTADSYAYKVRRLSYFGRLEYNYDGKYLFEAIMRSDSSSRFGPDNKTGYFPSVSGGWILSEEEFFPSLDVIDYFKIRSSYGVLGNDRIDDNLFLSLLDGEATYVSAIDGSLIQGQALGALANPAVKWEEARRFNIGLDTELFDNKVSITADYFVNNREDLLIGNSPVSGILGIAAPGSLGPTLNAGTVRNSGIEFAINYSDNISDDFSFNVGYNISTLNNEVTEVNGADFLEGGDFGIGQPAPARMEEGKPIGYFYGYKTNGIFQTQAEADAHPDQSSLGNDARAGDIRYVDLNGDGVIDENDRTDIGNPIPDITTGINLSLNYKNFDFSTYAFSNLGNDIVRNFERNEPNVNRMSYRLDRWTGPGTSNSVPRVTTEGTSNNAFSDFFVEDGSFVRIQTVSLGYTFPEKIYEKAGLSNLRVYAKVDNVYTFTEYSGYDPTASTGEPIGSGIDFGFYPLPRTFILGLNVEL